MESSIKPRNFRVPVATPTELKIKAVAEYKKRNLLKEVGVSTAAPATVQTVNNELDTREKLKLLEQLYVKGQELHQEFESLNDVRYSLMWLLQRVTLLETQRNHSENA